MSVEHPGPGYAFPAVSAELSPAAAIARALSLRSNVSSHELGKSRVIVDQGRLPCCVSSALAAAMEVLYADWPRLAPLFHYYVTRYERGAADSKGFLYLKDSLTVLNKVGISRHDLHQVPFDEVGSSTKPGPAAYADALTRAFKKFGDVKRYRLSDGLSRAIWIRDQLRQGRPALVGFQLPDKYPHSFLNPNFEWLDSTVTLSGVGHCVLIRGYNDLRAALLVQDSRGKGAFEAGCWWMGDNVVDSHIVQDVYSLAP